ncbi:hypothetical protein GBAR_LOCUS28634, partial [Geodia barretti]
MMSGASNQVSTSTAVPPNLLQTEQLNRILQNSPAGILVKRGRGAYPGETVEGGCEYQER